MSEYKPYAERLKDEVNAFFRLWRHQRWLAIVFLVILLIVAVYFPIGWFTRGSTIQDLKATNRDLRTEIADLKRDLKSLEQESKGLRETVAPLIRQAVAEFPGEEINASLKKIIAKLELSDPRKQPILTATATVEIHVLTRKDKPGNKIAEGGYLSFGKNRNSFLTMSSRELNVRWVGENETVYRGLFMAEATQEAIGKPMAILLQTDVLQTEFSLIPAGSKITGGKTICTLNSAVQMTFEIPPQEMKQNYILLPMQEVTNVIGSVLAEQGIR